MWEKRGERVAGAQHQDNQCFGYDGLRRLSVAWTANSGDCTVAQDDITTGHVGGASPYWSEYSYDDLGNRTQLTEHDLGGVQDAVTDYEHGSGAAGPHQLSNVTRDNGALTLTSLEYDGAGNRIESTTGSATTEHEWDAEGELVASGTETYIYDASGNRLVRTSTTGTTVYLPGGQELTIGTGSLSATRYYSFAGSTVAVRHGVGLGAVASLVTDHQGSIMAAVANTGGWQTPIERVRTDPFGATRAGSATGVAGDRQFLGATRDTATGLTLLGARYYDETSGTFLSVDPMLQPGVPAQFNAYVYSGNNPVTFSDPSGLWWGADLWNNVVKTATKIGNGIKTAANAVVKFVDTYKAEIVGGIVGAAVFIGCTAATGGVGVVGCAIAGGAAGGAVTSLMKSAETGKFSVQGLVTDIVIGGAIGHRWRDRWTHGWRRSGTWAGAEVDGGSVGAVGDVVGALCDLVGGLAWAVDALIADLPRW